jgi:lycopene cyclase domain-containing protein
MAYTAASFAVLAAALALALWRGAARDQALWLGLLVFLVLTVIADSTLIDLGVFGYATRFRSGLAVGSAPIEDLAYGASLYLVATTVWGWSAPPGRRKG